MTLHNIYAENVHLNIQICNFFVLAFVTNESQYHLEPTNRRIKPNNSLTVKKNASHFIDFIFAFVSIHSCIQSCSSIYSCHSLRPSSSLFYFPFSMVDSRVKSKTLFLIRVPLKWMVLGGFKSKKKIKWLFSCKKNQQFLLCHLFRFGNAIPPSMPRFLPQPVNSTPHLRRS